jgi:hypothetical protein
MAVILLLALCGRAAGAESHLAVGYQVPLVLKLLTYECKLMELRRQTIVMGILYRPADEASTRAFEQFRDEMKHFENRTIHNRKLVLEPLPVVEADSAGPAMRRAHVDVVYVTPGFDADLESIFQATRRGSILSVTGVPAYVEMGLTVAVVRRGDQAGITLNLEASRMEGRDWNASLLQLCRVIR